MNDYSIIPQARIKLTSQSTGDLYLEEVVESFLADLVAAGRTMKTVRFYRPYLRGICEYFSVQHITDLNQVTADILRKYLLLLQQRYNPGGLHAAYRAFRAFFNWVEFEELMPSGWKNPIKKVRAPKVPQKVIQPILLNEVSCLLKTCSGSGLSNTRDAAIMLFLLDTGIRAQELCDLNKRDVDLDTGRVSINMGKGQKGRVCFINAEVSRAIKIYLDSRSDNEIPLFVSVRNHRLTYDGLRQMLERRIETAQLTSSRSLHDFRRAFAINMLRKKVDIYSLQKLMGHADLSVLRRYLDLVEDDLENAHDLGSPVESLLNQSDYRVELQHDR